MTPDADSYRKLLATRLSELDEQDRISAADRAPVQLDQDSVGRLSRIDAMQVQAMALAQERRRANERMAIRAAMIRLDVGEFGYCAGCGEPIADARLRNNPTVIKCLECTAAQD